ncbi:hypothetical protein [Xylophilus sp. GOD-11R]|uniref:hypothetical protein n=1 Tax=Xylophilus sp. GOD-11R TaxID=3089814 RepID=UPI00298C59F0|nr:hypothetical protein [Xylophilus sp. GOD-11R]WPB59206.1 hypothetical protein R9X41_11390 [Xylophilus sp. GOD-11R]
MVKIFIGDYVSFDHEKQSNEILPLLECLIYAITPGRPLDYFLKNILANGFGPTGGDPGWSISWIEEPSDALYPDDWQNFMNSHAGASGCFEAWTYQKISMLDPCYAYYDRHTLISEVQAALENIKLRHPDRSHEVDKIIKELCS